jgi:hypothetical protein
LILCWVFPSSSAWNSAEENHGRSFWDIVTTLEYHMVTAVVLSVVAATLSLLAFCLARWPLGWMKLWCPQREYLAAEYLSPQEKRFLTHIRFRASLAGILLLTMAILMPVLVVTSFRMPSRAWGQTPETNVNSCVLKK